MANIFNDPKYTTASNKALAFIQAQMSLFSSSGHLPASYIVPDTDPLWNITSGNVYKVQQRCWIDSAGVALLVLTTSGDYARCKIIMNAMQSLPKSSGGFYSSYDVVEGHLGNDVPVHTGKIAWLVWGMCYYALLSSDRSYDTMIINAGTWLLGRQVNNTSDLRHGLLMGGFEDGEEYKWCSTENNLSALQALQGLALLTTGVTSTNYTNAANLILDRLKPTPVLSSQSSLYISSENRYRVGTTYNKTTGALGYNNGWALDCTTWAGATAKNLLPSIGISPNRDTIASNCRSTASSNFLVTGITSLSGVYGGYSLSGTVKGFKPDDNGGGTGTPLIVWSEGTLGYIHLCMLLGLDTEALTFMDETIKLQNCKSGQNGILYSTHRVSTPDNDFRVWESVVSSAWMYLLINNPDVFFKIPPPPPTDAKAYIKIVNSSSSQVQGNVQIPSSGFNRSFSMGPNSSDPSSGWSNSPFTLVPGSYSSAQALIAPPYDQDPLPPSWYRYVYLHFGTSSSSPPQIAQWTSAWDGSSQNRAISLNINAGNTYYIIINLS